MNKIIQAIATLMIILLLVVLIWVFLAYYGDNKILDTISYSSGNSNNFTPGIPNSNYVPNEKHTYDNLIESIKNNSGNQENTEYLDGKKEDETLSENIIFSGDINQQHNTENSGDKEEISNIIETLKLENNDLVFIITGDYKIVKNALGSLRCKIARDLNIQ